MYIFLTFSALQMFPSATVSPQFGHACANPASAEVANGVPPPVPGQTPSSPLWSLHSACSCQGCTDAAGTMEDVGTMEDSGMLQQTDLHERGSVGTTCERKSGIISPQFQPGE